MYARGRLTKVSTPLSTTEYTSFDQRGRITAHKQTTDLRSFETSYLYNLSGALIEETYPSGRKVKNILDANGSLSQVQSKKNQSTGYWNYADGFTYNAAGDVTSVQLGNGHWESSNFNSRLQPTRIALGTTANGTDLLKLDYSYGTGQNNGNVQSQAITVPALSGHAGFTATQNYTYDQLNRIKDATETVSGSQTWKQAFSYDRFGNRNFDEANTTTLPKNCAESSQEVVCTADRKVVNPAIEAGNNRLAAGQNYVFDSAGNTTVDAQNRVFIYDGENKQVEVSENNILVGRYFYDGEGRRIKKETAAETTIFVYDASGKTVAEYSTQLSPEPQVAYLTNDNLGTPRINTSAGGAVIARHDYHPFGEEISTPERNESLSYNSDDVRQKFTGYERDQETDLDYAKARYFNSGFGRFSSPDNFLNATTPESPESWNLYAYVLNNPLRLVDRTGEVQTDKDGNVIFFGNKKIKTITFKGRRNKALKDGKEYKINGKTVYATVTWQAEEGYILADDGTHINASKAVSKIEVKLIDEDGKVFQEETEAMQASYDSDPDLNKADCHGTTFAKGQVWINNPEVDKLLEGDGYRKLGGKEAAEAGDVGIYRRIGGIDPNGSGRLPDEVVHSVTLDEVNTEGKPSFVSGKAGIDPYQKRIPAGPGAGTAWETAKKEVVKLEVWTRRAKSK
jgi:RHS repeat-associated protein